MSTDNIIDFAAAIRLEPQGHRRTCRCLHVYVDEQNRVITCQHCERVMDPFDFLMREAKKQKSTIFDIDLSKKELADLQQQISDLRRERQNLKAQVNRLKQKTGLS